ncbi:MAG: hypothetical protein ACOCVL_03355, partial [Candidatus Sumerlaeota bacterium]
TVGDYDTGSVLTEDYDYWIRVSKNFPMLRLDDELYDYRTHGETLTAREGRGRVNEMIDKTRRRHFSPSEIRAAEALREWRRSADLRAAGLLLKALVRRPGDTRLYKPLVLSLLPDIVVRCAVKCRKGNHRD